MLFSINARKFLLCSILFLPCSFAVISSTDCVWYGFLSKPSFRSLVSKHIRNFFLSVWFGEWWLPVSYSTITHEFIQSVCSVTSSSIPCLTRDSISSLKADSRWTGTFLGACHAGLYSGLRWNLFTEVLPLCGCLTFLKANDTPGLQTWTVGW